jgi:hypothetical protein
VILLAAELIALIVLFAADDTAQGRGPAATWSKSFLVIGAAAGAIAALGLFELVSDQLRLS